MKTETKEKIKTLAADLMQAKSLSQNAAAAMMGISPATLSQLFNGKWDLISEEMWRKVAKWCGYNEYEWKIRESANLNLVVELCADAQENCRWVALPARTGYGKTTGLKYFYRQRQNVYYTLCTVTMGRKELLRAILKSIGLEVEGSIHRMIYAIINKLATVEGARPVLLLDDYGKLSDPCKFLVQIIYDELIDQCGIVVAGIPEMYSYIRRMAGRGKIGFPELLRRIAYCQVLEPVSKDFVRLVASDYGITSPQVVDFIAKKCHDFGTLRELMRSYSIAEKAGKTPLEIIEALHIGSKMEDAA